MAQNYTPEVIAEKFLICPFVPVHFIEPQRMAFHLTKCTKNMTKNKFLVCPFDSNHMIDEKMMTNHVFSCSKRIMYESYRYIEEGSDPVIGADIPPPEIENPGETWDLDTNQSYQPSKFMEENKGSVMIVPIGSRPAERRAFRQQQRINFSRKNRQNKNEQ